MNYFEHLWSNPPPNELLNYLKTLQSTEAKTEGITLLGRVKYEPASPFIKEKLEWAINWYNRYKLNPNAKRKDLALRLITTSKTALNNLTS